MIHSKTRPFGVKILAFLLIFGIVVPHPCRSEIALPPLNSEVAQAGRAFVLVLGPEAWVIAGVVVVGVATYQYYSAAPKISGSTEATTALKPELKLVPSPGPERKDPKKKNDSTPVLELISAYALSKIIRDHKVTGRVVVNPSTESFQVDKRLREIVDLSSEELVPGTYLQSSAPKMPQHQAEHVVAAQVINHLMNSRQHEFKYDKSQRYAPGSNWGVYNPDLIRQWATSKQAETLSASIYASKNALGASVNNQPKFSIKKALERLEETDLPPSGYSDTVLFRELAAIEEFYRNRDYHHQVEKIREFQEDIQIYRKAPEKKELVDYWERQLRKSYITATGLLSGLGAREIPALEGAIRAPYGPRLIANINHVLIARKTLDSAWSFYAIRDGLTQVADPEVASRVNRTAHAIEVFDVLSDKFIGDLIEDANDTSVDQEKATDLVNDYIRFGEDLQNGEGNLEDKLEEWNREHLERIFPWLKDQPAAAPTRIPSELEEYRNWRILEESVRTASVLNEQNWTRGSLESAETVAPESTSSHELQNEKGKESSPSENSAAKTATEKPADKVEQADTVVGREAKPIPLSKIRPVLKALRASLGGKGLRNKYGDLFELVGIELSDDANSRVPNLQPPHLNDSVILILKTKTAIAVARIHRFEKLILQDSSFYAPLASTKDPLGGTLNRRQLSEKFSLPPPIPSRIAVVEIGAGQTLRISVTSKIFRGIGNAIQYFVDQLDKTNAKIISDSIIPE